MATRIGFFVRTRDKQNLETLGFYRDDLLAFRELGCKVLIVNRVRDLLKHRDFDVMYAWWFGFGFFAVLWARLLGKPSILTGAVHTVEGGGIEDWPWHKRLLMKAALRLATRTVFISRADFDRLGRARASSPTVAYCAVDLATHRPGGGVKSKLVVSISHLTPDNLRRKMLLESVTAFSLFHRTHPDYRYVVAGVHGGAEDQVRAHVVALGLTDAVDLPGRVSFERKIELLQSATAYLQPSRCEGFGLAILEAQACGCPVVTNREPCIREISRDAVLYGDTCEELAERLAALADDQRLAEEMRARGLANARRFSHEARREALREILTSVGMVASRPAEPVGVERAKV